MNRSRSLALGAVVALLVAGAVLGPFGGSPDDPRGPSAGVAVASSGPDCFDGNVSSNPPLRLISGTDDTSITFETVIVHDGSARPNVSLDYVRNGTYELSISTEPRPGVTTDRTATPDLVGRDCQVATRINVTGRMSNPVETLRIVVDGERVRTIQFEADGRRVAFPDVLRLGNTSTATATDE